MNPNRRDLLSLAAAVAIPAHSFAQASWPNKAVRIVVPFAEIGRAHV